MAEDRQESSQKTEQPTERKLEEAREKGNVPLSRELVHWVMILTSTFVFMALIPLLGKNLFADLRPFIANTDSIPIGETQSGLLAQSVIWIFAKFFLGVGIIFIAAATLSTGVQTRFRLKEDGLKPSLENLSWRKGLKKIFSMNATVEFLKSTLKILIVAIAMFYLIRPEILKNEALISADFHVILHEGYQQLGILFLGVVILMAVLAGLDYGYQYYKYMRDMRMSREEIKQEHKQQEGDPAIKQKIRALRRERLAQKLTEIVPTSTVIITNPTHYSIALKYDENEMAAPVVIAKGIDHMALQIRLLAKKHQIPIMQDPPLARTLYDTVKVGAEIKVEHYRAVAKIIQRLYELQGRLPQQVH